MYKGYFVYPLDLTDKNVLYYGIYKKINTQINALRKVFDVSFCSCNYKQNNSIMWKIIKRLPFMPVSFFWKYDGEFKDAVFLYFRMPPIDYSFLQYLKKIKQRTNCIVLLEIPTYPYDGEKATRGKISDFFYLRKERHNRKKLHKYIDRIVTFSNDKEIFGIKTINTINGVDFNGIRPANYTISDESINIIEVSIARFWHGYDRFIRGMGNYYRQGGKENLVFHIVGDGPEIELYKKLCLEYGLENHIVFHGNLTGEALDEVYNKCCIGIDAIGCHRKTKTKYGISSIKSREYAAKGLPMIVSLDIDFLPDNYEYCLTVPFDDSDILIDDVISFYHRIFDNGDASEVIKSIREYSYSRCDINITMKPVINYILQKNDLM